MSEIPQSEPREQRAPSVHSATAVAALGRVAIVCALEREVAGLVKGWRREVVRHAYRQFRVYENERAIVVVAGIGADAARHAAEVALERSRAEVLISAGFAGETVGGLEIAGPYTAAHVVDVETGRRYRTLFGLGTLASAGAVLGTEGKKALFERFGAHAVDMEAAAVGEVAERQGTGFLAVKAISDLHDFPMPPLQKFVGPNGDFRTVRFVGWMAVRPGVWGTVRELSRNTARAAETLQAVLGSLLTADDLGRVQLGKAHLALRPTAGSTQGAR